MKLDCPRVSVIIPSFRKAQFLGGAVDSLVAQTYPFWECVIVNDGSPDDTSAVARQLAAKYPQHRISLIEQENHGLPMARNNGAAATSGEYLVPLDADDQLAPEMLAQTCSSLDAQADKSIAYTDIQCTGDIDSIRDYSNGTFSGIIEENTVPVTALIRRSLFERACGYNPEMREGYEDWDFWLRCAEQQATALHIPQALFLYRVSSDGMFSSAVQRDTALKARLVSQHPKLYSALRRRWADSLLHDLRADGAAPPLRGQSLSQSGRMPSDGEALGDLGTLAIWNGDIASGVALWAQACCTSSTSYALYTHIAHTVDQMGLNSLFAAEVERIHPVSAQPASGALF